MSGTADAHQAALRAAEDTLATAMALRRGLARVIARMLQGIATEAEVDAAVTRAVRAVDAAGRTYQAIQAMVERKGGPQPAHVA